MKFSKLFFSNENVFIPNSMNLKFACPQYSIYIVTFFVFELFPTSYHNLNE